MSRNPITTPLRQALIDRIAAGQSLYSLAQQSGIDKSQLTRFRDGTRALGQDAIDRLARVLGVTVTQSTD